MKKKFGMRLGNARKSVQDMDLPLRIIAGRISYAIENLAENV
jgi:hypothetical protein